MASLQIEVASSSSAFTYSSLRDHNPSTNNIKGYLHPQCVRKNKAEDDDEDDDQDTDTDSSWLPSQNSKTDNDDSWLPTSTLTSQSESSHRKGKNEVDDGSWLPTTNDTARKSKTNTHQSEKDIDYSWLPSTFTEKQQKKPKNDVNDKNKNKSNTTKNNNNNNNSNINSNSNNRTQKKSGNDHWALAREVVFSCDSHVQNKELWKKTSDSSKKKDSPSKSRCTVESPTSGGVSSLLQRWRELAEAKNSNKNGNVSSLTNRNNAGTGSTSKENNPSSNSSQQSPPSKDSDADWESDHTNRPRRFSCPLPSRDSQDNNIKDSNAEKEKIRVVDIIKKLSREEELAASAASGNGNESLPPIRTSLDHQKTVGEQKQLKGVRVSRHLIRGRQAFNNFLMQMEHEKHRELKWLGERKAVSKFSHRGRIQALLRFTILRLGAEPKPEDKRHKRCISKTLDPNNRLDIMDLRERFNYGFEKGSADLKKDKRTSIKNTETEETSTDFKTKTKLKTTSSSNITSKKEEPRSKQEPMTPNQSTSSCKDVVHKAKEVDTSSKYPIERKELARYKVADKYDFHEDEGQFMSAKTSYSHIEDKGMSDSEDTNYAAKKQELECFEDWMTSEYSQTRSDLDEDDSYDKLFESSYDWISDISRPKSDWEDMRQARYQEMLNHSSGNADIRRLLERKSVSRFLSSSLRDSIDQLMMSRIQQSHVQVEKQEVVATEKGGERKEEVEQEDGSLVDDFGDCRSRNDNEKGSDYCETPYSEGSWRPNDGIYSSETTTTTTTTTSPSLDRSLSSNRSQNNSTPQSSSGITHHSIEMDIVYGLRGHMEQLHQEIMELRKSIKCCVNMQIKMQRTFKQNVATAPATRPVPKKERKPHGPVGNDCSICSVKQADSLLYRCGHICACFVCAVELQRTSGECPVCEAPIVDVVRAFAHEN